MVMAHKHHIENGENKKHSPADKLDSHAADHVRLALAHRDNTQACFSVALNQVDRRRYYISQIGDHAFRSYMFGCGPSSLTEALADWGAINPKTGKPTVHQPPTEADRVRMMEATGTMSAGKFPGGPDLMATFARRFGLHAETHGPSIDALDKAIRQGKGAIVGGSPRPGHGHYIYVAGIDKQGYIVGDPGHYKVTHWTREHLDHFMRGRRGFVAVWNGQTPTQRRDIVDAGGAGYVPTPIVTRLTSYHPESGHRSGGNGSLFREPRRDTRVARKDSTPPVHTASKNVPSESANDVGGATEVRPPSGMTQVASLPSQSDWPYGGSIPRTFPPPRINQDVGNSSQDNIPDDASLEDGLAMQDSTDRIVAHVTDQDDAYTAVDLHDPPDSDFISVGAGNWNQQGDLPQLFSAWAEDNPQTFNTIFGTDGRNLLNPEWVQGHNFNQDPALMAKINLALADPGMQRTQTRLTREVVSQAVTLGYENGVRSQSGLAIVADACNQAGYGAVKTALQMPDVRTAIQLNNESQALAAMENHLNTPAPATVAQVIPINRPIVQPAKI